MTTSLTLNDIPEYLRDSKLYKIYRYMGSLRKKIFYDFLFIPPFPNGTKITNEILQITKQPIIKYNYKTINKQQKILYKQINRNKILNRTNYNWCRRK